MKRLRRILLNTLTAISLLLAIATVGLWVRSYSSVDHVGNWRLTVGPKLIDEACWGVVSRSGALFIASRSSKWPSEFGTNGYHGLIRDPLAERSLPPTSTRWGWVENPPWWKSRLYVGARHNGIGGIEYQTGITLSYGETGDGWYFRIPFGYVIAMLLIAPSVRLWRSLAAQRAFRSGHCPACGYDMRANPARCSECGREAVPK